MMWAFQELWLVTEKLLFQPGGSGACSLVSIWNGIPTELLPFRDKSIDAQRYLWELGWGTVEWTENYKLSEKFLA